MSHSGRILDFRASALGALALALSPTACGGLECGPGTTDVGGVCTPAAEACGMGTRFDAATEQCLAEAPGIECGAGTRLEGTTCVLERGLACGAGTVLDAEAERCVPAPEVCGENTQFDMDTRTCIASRNVTCGEGTVAVDGVCRPAEAACGPGTVYDEASRSCIRGEVFTGDCADPQALPTGDLEGLLTVTEGSCALVPADLRVVSEGELRVEAGSTLIFAENVQLTVRGGLLSAVGTAEAPIRFRGQMVQPGYWEGVRFWDSDRAGNRLEHVVLSDAGGGMDDPGIALELYAGGQGAARVGLVDVTLRDNAGHALGGDPIGDIRIDPFDRVTIEGSELAPVRLPAETVADLDEAIALDEQAAWIEVSGGVVTEDATWVAQPVPLRVTADLTTSGELTLAPGIVLEMGEDVSWRVPSSGVLLAEGGEEGIVIRGAVPLRGSWQGLLYAGESRRSVLERTTILHGGAPRIGRGLGNLILESETLSTARITIRSSTLAESLGFGLDAPGNQPVQLVAFEGNTLRDNALGAAQVRQDIAIDLDTATRYTGNDQDRVVLTRFGTVSRSGVMQDVGVPWECPDGLNVEADLEIAQGAELRFGSSTDLYVATSGSLRAIGGTQPAEQVRLHGITPSPGAWYGVVFFRTGSPLNRLEHVSIRHAGGAVGSSGVGGPALSLNGNFTAPTQLELDSVVMTEFSGPAVEVSFYVRVAECRSVVIDSPNTPLIVGAEVSNWTIPCGTP